MLKALVAGLGVLISLAGIAAGAIAAPDPIRIVVQNQGADQDDPDISAFSPDDRYIVTMSSRGSNQVLLRDADTGIVISRLTLPHGPRGYTVVAKSITYGPNDTTATATAFATSNNPQVPCRWVTYAIDLAAMQITESDVAKGSDDCGELAPSFARLNGLLAKAHNSGLQLLDTLPDGSPPGLYIVNSAGTLLRTLQRPQASSPVLSFVDAAMAADGRTLAMVAGRGGELAPNADPDGAMTTEGGLVLPTQHSTVVLFDTTAMTFGQTIRVDGSYTRVRWLDAGHFVISRDYRAGERDVAASMNEDRSLYAPPPAQVIEAATGAVDKAVPMQCYLTPLPTGGFIGAGLANCLSQFGASPRGLLRYLPGTGWQSLAGGVEGNGYIDTLAVTPDGRSLAAMLHAPDDALSVITIDIARQTVTARLPLGKISALARALTFEADGPGLIIQIDDKRWRWLPHGGQPPVDLIPANAPDAGPWPDVVVADRNMVIDVAPGNDPVRIDRRTGARKPDLPIDTMVAGGFVPGLPEFWALSANDGLRFWDTRNWAPMQSIVLFAGNHALAYMPDGRYDTDLDPDSDTFRWHVIDDPLRALGPQTFLRTYYTPRMLAREQACIVISGGCAAAFPKVPAPLDLNRVLPEVTIDAVRPGRQPGTAEVDVTVREIVDRQAANHQTRSGIYDLRLFRNGSLVARYPAAKPVSVDEPVAAWQDANRIKPGADGRAHHRFVVALPSGPGSDHIEFSAYAFNSDRIKSNTFTDFRMDAKFLTPARPPQTFVLAIGIDQYVQDRLALRFAVNDATLITRQLGQFRTLTLAGDAQHAQRPIGKAMILAAIDLLAGGDRADDLALLRTAGIDGSAFVRASPDDTVIVTYSGHGWADPAGNFFILPADAQWDNSAPTPVLSSLLSAAELADALQRVDARDMALVIDACHSAASVDTAVFKPGPLGDPGLGQLAWDKAIRILAAAGRDDVAWESDRIRQGLLTYALAKEGIDDKGFGQGDLNGDGRIMLDEWLRYAVDRLPALSVEALSRPGSLSGHKMGQFIVLKDSQAVPPTPQTPALFDFTRHASTALLRERHP